VVIPPACGLRQVGFETFTADGPVSYWNRYVGVSQMGGHGSFSDARIAGRGAGVFHGIARCSSCHLPPTFTDVGRPASRARFHDGSAKDLAAVVSHYNTPLSLGLTPQQQADLVEYLKSL
jgi:cytochrome c peroxidase